MRAMLRTYHSIPALQAHQDPNAYKQLQDAPRLKSILKGATEDVPQPGNIEDIKAASLPRTNPVNLIFVMSQYAPKISEAHFHPPRDFFDLVMRSTLSSASRARAFLWLVWWYLESDFSYEDSQRNPFGPGQLADGEKDSGVLPLKVPPLESLTEEQTRAENQDTEEEKHYGEVKRKERIAILASEPSPAMTALKRARKERELVDSGRDPHSVLSEDEISEPGWSKAHRPSAGRSTGLNRETASDYTRSPSPPANRSFHTVNAKPGGGMRINNILNNDEATSETSPPRGGVPAATGPTGRKGPGRGNWRRSRPKQEAPLEGRPHDERSHHVPLLPNTSQLSFVNEGPHHGQPATPRSHGLASSNPNRSNDGRDHVPTPSYQAQKRHRGITQHQSAVISHRRQQIDYTLDRRIRKVHLLVTEKREVEGSFLRPWKRIRLMPKDYDSEEEQIRIRKAKTRAEAEEDWRAGQKGKENVESYGDVELLGRPRILMAGFVRLPGEPSDVGEEAKSLAMAFRRCSRRLERWENADFPGEVVIQRRQAQSESRHPGRRRLMALEASMDQDSAEVAYNERSPRSHRHRSGTGRSSSHQLASERVKVEQKMELELDENGGPELDEEDRELLGEVDPDDESEGDDEDEDMGED